MSPRHAMVRIVVALWCLPMVLGLGVVSSALAAPVEWREVPATAEGRQWWDAGSLRLSKTGRLTVLSRFTPPAPEPQADGTSGPRVASDLYVMELDCDQELYRDISVNGLPRFRPEWQAAAGDALSTETLREACRAGSELLRSATERYRGAANDG